MINCRSLLNAINQPQNLIQTIGVLATRSCTSRPDPMKNLFRRETISSHLVPSEVLSRMLEQAIPYESIVDWSSPIEGYKTFVRESLVGDKVVVAKIQGSQFELMPIGIWPVKGQVPASVAGALFGRVDANGSGSSVDIWYRTPLISTIFVSVFFLVACLFSLMFAGILVQDPDNDDRIGLIVSIIGFPAFAFLFGALGLVQAWQQSRLLRRFVHEILRNSS